MAQIDYERFFNLSFDLLCVIGPTHVIEVNQAFVDKLGYSQQELLSRPWVEFVHPEDRAASLASFGQEGVRRYTNRFMTRSGDVIWLEWSSRYIATEDVSYEVARDVTDRMGQEEQLSRTLEDLRRSNEELERFAYVASHDLQEPLRMVSSYLELLEGELPTDASEDAREFLKFATDGASRMRQLIEDLLKYSRVGRNASFDFIDSRESLNDAIKILNGWVEKNATLYVSDELPKVWADKGMLTRVFLNLVGNAVKFRREDEPLNIHVDVSPLYLGEDKRWMFSVRDNGKGFDDKYAKRIFDVFQRLSTSRSGTGIGLAECKKIVERHGGRIWAEARPNEGAAFYFTLRTSPLREV